MIDEFTEHTTPEARRALADWVRGNGLRKSRRYPSLYNLTHQRRPRCPWDEGHVHDDAYPAFDHMTLWTRNGKPAVLTSHPYPVSGEFLLELLEKCKALGVTVYVSPCSWYFPGATLLIEMWAPAAEPEHRTLIRFSRTSDDHGQGRRS